MRSRRLIVTGASFAAIVLVIAVAVASRSGDEAPASLRIREGHVSLARGSSAVRLASEGEDLRSGDVIQTDNVGRAQVDLLDGSLIRIDANTELALDRIDPSDDKRDIVVTASHGRAWHRVVDGTQGGYVAEIGRARISVTGTTFMTDCRQDPVCHVVGFDGRAEMTTDAKQVAVENGDCFRVGEDASIERCNPSRLGLIDSWVRENLAEDESLELRRIEGEGTPPPSPTETPERTSGPRPPAPIPVATPSPTVSPTTEPTPTEEHSIPTFPSGPQKTKKPRTPTPAPTAPPPTSAPPTIAPTPTA